jgi:hypothetical protein
LFFAIASSLKKICVNGWTTGAKAKMRKSCGQKGIIMANYNQLIEFCQVKNAIFDQYFLINRTLANFLKLRKTVHAEPWPEAMADGLSKHEWRKPVPRQRDSAFDRVHPRLGTQPERRILPKSCNQ